MSDLIPPKEKIVNTVEIAMFCGFSGVILNLTLTLRNWNSIFQLSFDLTIVYLKKVKEICVLNSGAELICYKGYWAVLALSNT